MTDGELRYPFEVERAADEIENARCADEVDLRSRWSVVDGVLTPRASSFDRDDSRNIHAVDHALICPEAAMRLVREGLGNEIEVHWFWNCCQGHYAEVSLNVDGMLRQGRASASTIALSIVVAAMRFRLAKPERMDPVPAPPRRTVTLSVVQAASTPVE